MTDRDGQPYIIPDLGPLPPIVIPYRQPKPPGKAIWVTRDTFDRLCTIKKRTGQSFAIILAILVERAQ